MKKVQMILAIVSMLIIGTVSVSAQPPGVEGPTVLKAKKIKVAPDLRIRKFSFVPTNQKALRIYVQNVGNKSAGANRLRIRVRKIEGISVSREKVVAVPKILRGKGVWLVLNG